MAVLRLQVDFQKPEMRGVLPLHLLEIGRPALCIWIRQLLLIERHQPVRYIGRAVPVSLSRFISHYLSLCSLCSVEVATQFKPFFCPNQ
jgi:hypothetical protein